MRSRLGLVSIIAGIVAIAVLSVYGVRFFSASSPNRPGDAPPSSATTSTTAPVEPDHVPETPPLERALVAAGYERERIGTTGGTLFLETFDPPEVVAHKIQVANVSLHATVEGQDVRVNSGTAAELVRIITLKRDTEGESFVEADEVPPAKPPKRLPGDSAVATGSKRIVLILDDVGFENQPLEAAAAIDAALTFAVIPTAPRAVKAAAMLTERGFEVICHLPMEPLDYPRQSPGREAILVSLTNEEIRERTRAGLRAVPNASGVNNHMGSRATRDRRVMENVAEVLREEG
ncbi:MAG: divergent polysaccharide deacetylase family protein, partial [Thermoanaerobaculia bacterium]|nr:divergent polysaccharide deacetylase family protein [Thermoanaerobaculia bacterium]